MLTMVLEKLPQRRQTSRVLPQDLRADLIAQRVVVGRGETGGVPGRVDCGHDREQSGAAVELPLFRSVRVG